MLATVGLEKDFKHGANNECKVCGNEAPVEEDPHVPHLQPSPGTSDTQIQEG